MLMVLMLAVSRNLWKEGNAKEAKKYLQKMFAVVDAPHHHANIGNPVVDAILTQYLSICEQRKIHFEIFPTCCKMLWRLLRHAQKK